MQIVPTLARRHARNDLPRTNPFHAQILTRIGATCIVRRDEADPGARASLWSDLQTGSKSATEQGAKRGMRPAASLPLGARLLTSPLRRVVGVAPLPGDKKYVAGDVHAQNLVGRLTVCDASAAQRVER